jgi:hypothetical protein
MKTEINTKRLEPLDRSRWATLIENPNRFAVWTSEIFSVQAFNVPGGIVRLTINRNKRILSPRLFDDGISWEDLQAIKDECGYADRMAVEIYPEANHILNVINARHLWILPAPLPFAWRIEDGCLNVKMGSIDS